jgi:hypothetical protein
MKRKDYPNLRQFGGLSFSVSIGKWGGVSLNFCETNVRLCLGFIAITLWYLDMDRAIPYIMLGRLVESREDQEIIGGDE